MKQKLIKKPHLFVQPNSERHLFYKQKIFPQESLFQNFK